MSDLRRELGKGAATIINEKQQLILMMSKEIKKLNAENEKLRAALKPFADEAQRVLSDMPDSIYWDDITVGMLRAAAAALKGTSDERRNRQATSDISRTPSS